MCRVFSVRQSALLVFCVCLIVNSGVTRADQIDAIWVGGTGNWNDAANWDGGTVPDNGADSYSVFIDDGDLTASEVSLNQTATISNLTLDSDDVLWINNSRRLYIAANGVVNNAGTINLNSTGGSTYFHLYAGPVTLTGGGALNLSDASSNWIYQQSGGSLVNVDNTIQGAGNIGYSSAPTAITNQGLIIANLSNTLTCTPGSSQVFTNTGTLRAENGATLALEGSGGFANAGGIIEALDASFVNIGATTILGGTLQTSGSGAIQSASTAATLDGTSDAITNSGLLRIPNSRRLYMAGTVHNTGTIELASTGSSTYLYPSSGVLTLTGGGTLQMSDNANNWIHQQGGGSLVNVDNTIRGAGRLGYSSAPTAITNQGLIIANLSTPLTCTPGSSEVFTNTGTLRAENGAVLVLEGTGGYANVGGVIEALDGSFVNVSTTTILGGTLQTSGSGAIQSASTAATLDGTLDAITNSGLLRIPNNLRFYMRGTIQNTGTIEMGSTGSNTYLHPSSGVLTLTGGGTLQMSDNANNWIYQQGGGSLVNVDNTIRGAGRLGYSSAPTAITNQGLIIANLSTPLTCTPGSSEVFTNTGTLRAENGATLALEGTGGYANVGGVIEALDGSFVNVSTTTILGGTLQTSGSGAIQSASTAATLDGTSDAITNSGLLRIPNNLRFYMRGTIQNTGTIEMGSTGSNTYLHPSSGVLTLTGGGTLQMSDNANNWIYQQGGGSLVNVDNTIRGAGRLGYSSAPTAITNQGAVIADGLNPLLIGGGSQLFDNQGAMSATGSGGMLITGGFTTSGTVVINTGSSIDRTGDYAQTAGSTTVDGTLSASGIIDIQGGILAGSGTVQGEVSNAGSVEPGSSAGVLTIDADYSQTAGGRIAIEIGGLTAGAEFDRLDVTGNAALDGVLKLQISDGFDPMVGDTFVVMTFASRTGMFTSIDAPCLPAGTVLQVSISDTQVIVQVSDALVGDADCDCALSGLDLEAFILALTDPDAYQATYTNCSGVDSVDMNGDSVVDGRDIQGFTEAFIP